MDTLLHSTCAIQEVTKLNATTIIIKGLASTPTVDSHETSFSPMAFDLTRYKKNPVILYDHNDARPIGKVTNVHQSYNGLEIEATIYQEIDPQVFAMVHSGVLKAFSVGGYITEEPEYSSVLGAHVITSFELAEISLVAVPSNADSLITGVSLCELGACSIVRNYKKGSQRKVNTLSKLDSAIINAVIRKHVKLDL